MEGLVSCLPLYLSSRCMLLPAAVKLILSSCQALSSLEQQPHADLMQYGILIVCSEQLSGFNLVISGGFLHVPLRKP